MPATPKARPMAAVAAARVNEILHLILDGAQAPFDIREYVREMERTPANVWTLKKGAKPLSESQLRRYVAAAYQEIRESCRASAKKVFRRHLTQRRNVYAKAIAQGDLRAALASLDSEAKLLGLFPAPMPAATTPDAPVDTGTDEISTLVSELRDRLENGGKRPGRPAKGGP